MIYFMRKPDPIFVLILHEALEEALDDIREITGRGDKETWEIGYPCCSRCFSPEAAAAVVKQLLATSKEPDRYRITDYHYALLFDCLGNYCDLFNMVANERPDGLLALGEYELKEIDFEGLIEVFFWDTDFAFSPEVVEGLGEKGREEMGIADEVFGIAEGLEPHSEELRVERLDQVDWDESDLKELFRPGSTQYPDMDQAESLDG